MLDTVPRPTQLNKDPRRLLVDTLYGRRKLALDYDASLTRNASEAFEARSGNCLSLVIMTAAFAKAAGLPVEYRQVLVDDAWTRNNGLYFASGHVNLALGWTVTTSRFERAFDRQLVIDFLPADEVRGLHTRTISEATVLAMYMNNRAAESLVRGLVDDAYWWAREALRQDSTFLAAYNTLGVVYGRRGEQRWAQQVFQAVLAHEPDNTKVMGNLVQALLADGRSDEAQPLLARLAALEPFPPFHFFQAGLAAMQAENWRAARDAFRKEAARQAFNAEVHFWLAQANYRLGDLRAADRHLELARQNSSTPQDHALYGAKLGWLRSRMLN
jgi:Tfp pilus assembly protein PilF